MNPAERSCQYVQPHKLKEASYSDVHWEQSKRMLSHISVTTVILKT